MEDGRAAKLATPVSEGVAESQPTLFDAATLNISSFTLGAARRWMLSLRQGCACAVYKHRTILGVTGKLTIKEKTK